MQFIALHFLCSVKLYEHENKKNQLHLVENKIKQQQQQFS